VAGEVKMRVAEGANYREGGGVREGCREGVEGEGTGEEEIRGRWNRGRKGGVKVEEGSVEGVGGLKGEGRRGEGVGRREKRRMDVWNQGRAKEGCEGQLRKVGYRLKGWGVKWSGEVLVGGGGVREGWRGESRGVEDSGRTIGRREQYVGGEGGKVEGRWEDKKWSGELGEGEGGGGGKEGGVGGEKREGGTGG